MKNFSFHFKDIKFVNYKLFNLKLPKSSLITPKKFAYSLNFCSQLKTIMYTKLIFEELPSFLAVNDSR